MQADNQSMLEEVMQLKELVNLPKLNSKECNYLYNLAVDKVQMADFKNALPLLQYLTISNHTNGLYVKALAGCLHGLKEYYEAFKLYQIVYLLNPEQEYDCFFYSADCLYNINDYKGAKEQIMKFIEKVKFGNDQSLLKRAKLLLTSCENK